MSPDDEPIRDLAREIANRNKIDYCPSCGTKWKTPKTRKGLDNHQLTPQCIAESNAREMRTKGWTITGESSPFHRIVEGAGMQARRESTAYEKPGAWGREPRRGSLKTETWIPAWVAKLFDEMWRITAGYSNDEALPLLSTFVRELHLEPEKRAAVFAAKRLKGVDAVRGFIFTPKIRAARLRHDAEKLFAQAADKRREADELDPPEDGISVAP